MADIDSKLQIIIELLKKGQGATQATKDLEKLDKQQAKTKAGIAALSGIYRTFAASVLGVLVVRHISEAIKLFEKQEQAVAKLNGTLRASGQYSQEYSRELQSLASALQSVTRFGDETILSVQQQLIAFGGARDDIQLLTESTLDLAEGMGVDVKAAALLMGKAIAGEFSTLSRYGILVDQNATSSEKLQQALDQVRTRFGGLSREAAKTTTGALAQADNAIGDLKETIGELSLELAGGAEGISRMAGAIDGMNRSIQATPTLKSILSGGLYHLPGYRAWQMVLGGFDAIGRPNLQDSDGALRGNYGVDPEAARAQQERLDALRVAFDHRAIPLDPLGELGRDQRSEMQEVERSLSEVNAALEDREAILGRLTAAHAVEREALEASIRAEAERAKATAAAQAQLEYLNSDIGQITELGKQAFSVGLSRSIIDFTSGLKSAGEAFSEFGRNFLTTIADMILQTVIFNTVSRALGAFGLGGPAAAASGGMMPSKFAMGGVASVDKATFFPKFNTVAGEAGKEFLTVLRNPRMMSLGGMPAAVGRIGNHQLALVNFQQARTKFMAEGGVAGEVPKQFAALTRGGGGRGEIVIRMSPELRAEIVNDSVEGARLRVVQDMGQDSDLSRTTKRITT